MEFPDPTPPHTHPVGYTTPVCNAAEVDQGDGLEPGESDDDDEPPPPPPSGLAWKALADVRGALGARSARGSGSS